MPSKLLRLIPATILAATFLSPLLISAASIPTPTRPNQKEQTRHNRSRSLHRSPTSHRNPRLRSLPAHPRRRPQPLPRDGVRHRTHGWHRPSASPAHQTSKKPMSGPATPSPRIGLENAHLEDWGEFGLGWQQLNTWARMVTPDTAILIVQATPWSPSTSGPVTGEVTGSRSTPKKISTPIKQARRAKSSSSAPCAPSLPVDKPLFTRYTEKELEDLAEYPVSAGVGGGLTPSREPAWQPAWNATSSSTKSPSSSPMKK